MVRVAITGAAGLVGEGLLRLLLQHPDVEVTYLGSRSGEGRDIAELLPALKGEISLACRVPNVADIRKAADVAILAHKSAESLALTPALLDAGVKVIDIGGEFRLKDPALYKRWYGHDHTALPELDEAVYGLPELYRNKIQTARLVANPGCYPTSVILALAPLLKAGLIRREGICVSSASGLTGAGRTAGKLFIDANEDMRPYSVTGHKHRPEMEQELSAAAGGSVQVTFVPHLLPVNRGILTTIFARPAGKVDKAALQKALDDRYAGEPFTRARGSGGDVCIANVRGTNYCDVAAEYIEATDMVLAVSALDNMLKGACSQAIQNLNLMCGLNESAGIGGVRGN